MINHQKLQKLPEPPLSLKGKINPEFAWFIHLWETHLVQVPLSVSLNKTIDSMRFSLNQSH